MTIESAVAGFVAGTLTEEVIRRSLPQGDFSIFSSLVGIGAGIAVGSYVEDAVDVASGVSEALGSIFD